MIENTSQRDPLVHLLGMMSDGQSGYIEGMEAQGQRQVVTSDALPIESPWESLEALGFVRGEDVDDLFCRCTLPPGWTKAGTDHAMWSDVLDDRGIKRVSVFYKAAFYDRKAFAHVAPVGGDLATEALYGDGPVRLPEQWDRLTADERADFWRAVEEMAERAVSSPTVYGKYQPRVDALRAFEATA